MNKLIFVGLLTFSPNLLAAAPLYPLENFAKLPQYDAPKVSPDGRKIAATLTLNGKPVIYIKNRDAPEKIYPPINTDKTFFSGYEWANNDRLMIKLRGTTKFSKYIFNYTRLVSTNYDGSGAVGYEMKPNKRGFFLQYPAMIGQAENDPNHALMTLDIEDDEFFTPTVDLVDLTTGKKKRVQNNSRQIQHWIADKQGIIRIGSRIDTTGSKPNITVIYRSKENAAWEELQKLKLFDHDTLFPIAFDEHDDNILLVTSENLNEDDDEDHERGEPKLFRYNLTSREIEGEYIDLERKKAIATAEKALPGRKIFLISADKSKKVFTLKAISDKLPPQFFLLDRNTKQLDFLGSPYPALENAALSAMQITEYKARDNHPIPAYLTLPEGSAKNLPFIIYVHGGPWARDYWGFDNYVQFFASRGYGVLQPQYRGSTGFGVAHQVAGHGQWGRLIQDDITDGVKWLIAQGMANPKKICIVGASYGGYAAAAGLAKTPELYTCGISINGVMDLERLYEDMDKMVFKNINRAVFNDPNNLKVDSPYHLAEKIKAPLLLIASEKDTVVPNVHSQNMKKKLEKLHSSVTYVELPDGEHWRTSDTNEINVFKAMDQFLAAQLAP